MSFVSRLQGLFSRLVAPVKPSDLTIGPSLVDGYELRKPSAQNAVDLIPGWSTAFPQAMGIETGSSPHAQFFVDHRIVSMLARFGDITHKRVLELGPLEGFHTFMLDSAGAQVDAVESNGLAYLKCLITKEIMQIKHARFHLGDFNLWLEQDETKYDLIVASGVLYHMRDPLRLLSSMSKRSDALFIWAVLVKDDTVPPTVVADFNGLKVRLYRVPYGPKTPGFCGGPQDEPLWMHRNDLISVLGGLGYSELHISDETVSEYGPTATFFARRTGSA